MEHLVKFVVYLTVIRHHEAVYRTMGSYIKEVHPVCSGSTVVALARPTWGGDQPEHHQSRPVAKAA